MDESDDEWYEQPAQSSPGNSKRPQRSLDALQTRTVHVDLRNNTASDEDSANNKLVSDTENEQETTEAGEYEVEAILSHRGLDKTTRYPKEYLIKWKGYAPKHNSWEPRDHLGAANEVLQKYLEGLNPPQSTSLALAKKQVGTSAQKLLTQAPQQSKRKTSVSDDDAAQSLNMVKRFSVRKLKKQEDEGTTKTVGASTSKTSITESVTRRSRRLADEQPDYGPKTQVKVTGSFQFVGGSLFIETVADHAASGGECFMVKENND